METADRRILLRGIFLTIWIVFLTNCLCGRAMAKGSAQITQCVLSSGTKLRVSAVCDPETVSGKKCYLFALPVSGKITSGTKPLAKETAAQNMTFRVRISKDEREEMRYAGYVIAEKRGGKYRIISPAAYITNPGKTAKNRYAFPQAASKKGLQVAASMVEDAVELNAAHSVLNIVLSDLPAAPGKRNERYAIAFRYNGETYWIDRKTVETFDRQLETLKVNGTVVSAVLLLGYRPGYTWLIHPKARKKGYSYYAWNLSEERAAETFRALLSFLAERYSAKSSSAARIVNWIVGNEVESPKYWNYSGRMSLGPYVSQYVRQFRMVYTAVTGVYANARVYISLSHLWNVNPYDKFTGREILTAFASAISAGGYIPWNLAYHPYSSPLTEPKFWENKNGMLTAALSTPVINMGNLSVLTGYIRDTYGSATRIILSEQGFTSVQKGRDVQAEQAAAIAYSYLLTEADDMVDSFILNRHVDHKKEVKQGLSLGLWTSSKEEWADKKKSAWTMFKYMDTTLSEKVTSSALPVVGIQQWSDVIADYAPVLYDRVNLVEGNLQIVGGYKKARKIRDSWESYGAAETMTKKKGVYTLQRDGSRNPNCQWGLIQTFKNGLDMSAHPALCAALAVTGAKRRNVLVRMRFYSGRNEYDLSQVIPGKTKVRLKADLTGWAYAGSVTRIIITVEPVSGGWRKGAALNITRPVMGN